jgi:hypothetical protein
VQKASEFERLAGSVVIDRPDGCTRGKNCETQRSKIESITDKRPPKLRRSEFFVRAGDVDNENEYIKTSLIKLEESET